MAVFPDDLLNLNYFTVLEIRLQHKEQVRLSVTQPGCASAGADLRDEISGKSKFTCYVSGFKFGILGIAAMFGWGMAIVMMLASLYIGYSASVLAAIIRLIWAFIDGFIAGVVVAWVYNLCGQRGGQ